MGVTITCVLSPELWITRGKLWKTLFNWGELVLFLHKGNQTLPPYMGGGFPNPPYIKNRLFLWKKHPIFHNLSPIGVGINYRGYTPTYRGYYIYTTNCAKGQDFG